MRFAHLKVTHRLERMRLRGLTGARDEFHLRMKANMASAAVVELALALVLRGLRNSAKAAPAQFLCKDGAK
jgi:hypothetical protein